MTAANAIKHGDFTGLAQNYSRYRAGYAPTVRAAVLGLLGRPPGELDAVDVGAGTGIWTRALAECGFRSLIAVEPNDDMRNVGIRDSSGVSWRRGSGEQTGLDDGSADLVTMASSFHWVDFDLGTEEFLRVLRPGGWFVSLWNTRLVEENPLLTRIENELTRLKPDLTRVAFGRESFTASLTERLVRHAGFGDVVFLEGRHVEIQSTDRYLGAWRAVNDVRSRLGEDKFAEFLARAEQHLSAVDTVEVTYATRAWAAQRPPVSDDRS